MIEFVISFVIASVFWGIVSYARDWLKHDAIRKSGIEQSLLGLHERLGRLDETVLRQCIEIKKLKGE